MSESQEPPGEFKFSCPCLGLTCCGGGACQLLEEFGSDLAGAVDDADDQDAIFLRAVEDQVVADGDGAKTGQEVLDRAAHLGLPRKLFAEGGEAVDEPIRRGCVMPGYLNPDLDRVEFRLVGASGLRHVRHPRGGRREGHDPRV